MHQTYYRGRQRNLWDKIWKDRHGQVIVWQNPSPWLIAWAVLTMISLLLSRGVLADIFSWFGSGALITWSLLELFRGVNYFRRSLGLLVFVMAVATIIKLL